MKGKFFTKGPWRRFGGMVDGYGIVSESGVTIIQQDVFNGLNYAPNARLITAAPEMWNLLYNLKIDDSFREFNPDFAEEIDKVLDRIEKAV